MESKKAIATEYRGVKYRSKSEAMFAYCLERAGFKFTYENQDCYDLSVSLKPNKNIGEIDFDTQNFQEFYKSIHPWDFVLRHFGEQEILQAKYSTLEIEMLHPTCFIEYKPKDPTMTYMLNLREKIFKYIGDRIEQDLKVLNSASRDGRVAFIHEYGWHPCGFASIDMRIACGNPWDSNYCVWDLLPYGGPMRVDNPRHDHHRILQAMIDHMPEAKEHRFDLLND
jgi:hypothetical protein